ncbi:MAG: hypothetical protein E7337_00125 [Clostridiales bacterium]|nr:hypothetical protein [Clostridiales bacterium]
MKRKSFIVGIMLLCILLIGSTAFADQSYNFTFSNFKTLDTNVATKSNPYGSSYTLYITSASTLSTYNVFGARPKSKDSGSFQFVGSYYTYTSITPSTGVSHSYYNDKFPIYTIVFGMKKDDSSVTATPLYVEGSFRP